MKFYKHDGISSRLSRLKNILIRDENEINLNWLINFYIINISLPENKILIHTWAILDSNLYSLIEIRKK